MFAYTKVFIGSPITLTFSHSVAAAFFILPTKARINFERCSERSRLLRSTNDRLQYYRRLFIDRRKKTAEMKSNIVRRINIVEANVHIKWCCSWGSLSPLKYMQNHFIAFFETSCNSLKYRQVKNCVPDFRNQYWDKDAAAFQK